jgi:hypothetical protein
MKFCVDCVQGMPENWWVDACDSLRKVWHKIFYYNKSTLHLHLNPNLSMPLSKLTAKRYTTGKGRHLAIFWFIGHEKLIGKQSNGGCLKLEEVDFRRWQKLVKCCLFAQFCPWNEIVCGPEYILKRKPCPCWAFWYKNMSECWVNSWRKSELKLTALWVEKKTWKKSKIAAESNPWLRKEFEPLSPLGHGRHRKAKFKTPI